MFLVMLETNGNQSYIFASPRLRESIGASYQLTLLGQWVEDAWARTAKAHWEAQHPDYGTEAPWVSRSSGKVILMVDTEEQAKALIGEVTRRVLAEAPGMDVSGVYVQMLGRGPDVDDAGMGSSAGANSSTNRVDASHVTGDDLKRVHAEARRYAVNRPPAAARFAQMPFLARAQDSTLPAAPPLGKDDEDKEDQKESYSLPSRVKRYDALEFRNHLLDLARKCRRLYDEDDKLARDLTKLENMLQDPPAQESRNNATDQASDDDNFVALPKVAVIHIDGNGVGAIMRDLDSAKALVSEDDFVSVAGCKADDADSLRHFILAVNDRLDRAVENAFVAAWESVAIWAKRDAHQKGRPYTAIPVVPVIVGGDDVTVITSGEYALPFAAAYLDQYENRTRRDPLLSRLGDARGGATGPMTAAAGVAVVRRNFPFHVAYELAERLVKRAKDVGKPVGQSTIDYHVLFDSTVLDATEILRAYTSFTTRPFRLPQDDDVTEPSGAGARPRHASWRLTCERVAWFTGVMPPRNRSVAPIPFPKSRAARIRRLLSEAATAEASPHQEDWAWAQDRRAKAGAEWRAAATELKGYVDIDDKLGGPESVFDLLELAELLPEPYLRSVLNLTDDAAAPTTSTPEEARA